MSQSTATDNVVPGGYDIVLRASQGAYLAFVRELNLIGRGSTADAAVADLSAKWQILMRDLKEFGEFEDLPEPRSGVPQTKRKGELRLFVAKCAIVFVMIGALIGVVALVGAGAVRSIGRMNTNVLVEIDKLASRIEELPEARLKQTQDSLRIIGSRLGPLAAELRPLTHPEPPAGATSPAR